MYGGGRGYNFKCFAIYDYHYSFFVGQIDSKYETYDEDNNCLILNTTGLLEWNEVKSRVNNVIHCEVDLPGTQKICSDKITIPYYTSKKSFR